MRKLKKLMFILIVFLLTGCSVEYNLDINEDNSIVEKVVAKEKTNRMEAMTKLKGKQAVMYLYDLYKKDDNTNFSYTNDSTYTYGTAIKSYNDINEFANNFSNDVFDKVIISKKNNIIDMQINQKEYLLYEAEYAPIYNEIVINIKVPFEVVDSNADSVKNNVYTWRIKEEQKLKKIKISYKEGNLNNKINININDKVYNINYGVVFIASFVIIILIVFMVIYIKNRKNNLV